MIVYNLTDVPPPGQSKRGPQVLRVFGKSIPPGEHGEFPDDSPLGRVSGWVYTGKIGVDGLPSWYQAARRAKSTALKVVPDDTPKLVSEAEPDTKEEEAGGERVKYKKKKGKKK